MNEEADAYANLRLEHGEQYPYHGKPPKDWAERAALGVLADLCDRRGIKQELRPIQGDEEVSDEIVTTLADIIRTAAGKTDREVK